VKARGSAWRGRVFSSLAARGRVWVVRGEFTPAPRRRLLKLQKQTRSGKWRTLGRVRTARSGAYRTVVTPGVYRVVADGVAGDPVRAG
jgi:hypothetical protein